MHRAPVGLQHLNWTWERRKLAVCFDWRWWWAGCGGRWGGLTVEAVEVGGGRLLIPPALWTERTHQLSHSPTSNHGDLLLWVLFYILYRYSREVVGPYYSILVASTSLFLYFEFSSVRFLNNVPNYSVDRKRWLFTAPDISMFCLLRQ